MIGARCYQKQDLTAEHAEASAEERKEDILGHQMTIGPKNLFFRMLLLSLFLLATGVGIFAQDQPLKINYLLAMTRPNSHLFEVSIEIEPPGDAKIDSIDFQMPKWSPGRYAVFDFAKNVQEVSVGIDRRDLVQDAPIVRPVSAPCIQRLDDQTWRATACRNSELPRRFIFTYKVFANDLSGTFSQLDSRHANFNGGCIFMYVVNHKQDPVRLEIDPPKGWRIVNGRTDR